MGQEEQRFGDDRSLGQHILVEYHGCNADILNDSQYLETIMVEAANKAEATIIKSVFHQFSPQGASGVVVIAESHFAIHTWPEHQYAAVDLFTCNDQMNYKAAYDHLVEKLGASKHDYKVVKRGLHSELENNSIIS